MVFEKINKNQIKIECELVHYNLKTEALTKQMTEIRVDCHVVFYKNYKSDFLFRCFYQTDFVTNE